jgi:outer membrane immunogenic protein
MQSKREMERYMTLMKFIRASVAAVGALAVASVTQAEAADIYAGGGGMKDLPIAPPIAPWAGFYIGGHLGIDWTNVDLNRNTFFYGPWDTVGTPFGGDKLNTTGGFGGVQLGYNWQGVTFGPNVVFGIELDIGGLAGQDRRFFSPGGGVNFEMRDNGGFYGDITGRLGYTWGNVLVYAKGGFAWLNADFNARETVYFDGITPTVFSHDHNDTITGWTVGAGFEYMLNPNWSMKVEYLHFDFSNKDDGFCCNDGIDSRNNFRFINNDLTAETIKLGFNYFFHPVYAPLK